MSPIVVTKLINNIHTFHVLPPLYQMVSHGLLEPFFRGQVMVGNTPSMRLSSPSQGSQHITLTLLLLECEPLVDHKACFLIVGVNQGTWRKLHMVMGKTCKLHSLVRSPIQFVRSSICKPAENQIAFLWYKVVRELVTKSLYFSPTSTMLYSLSTRSKSTTSKFWFLLS